MLDNTLTSMHKFADAAEYRYCRQVNDSSEAAVFLGYSISMPKGGGERWRSDLFRGCARQRELIWAPRGHH